MKLLDLFVCLGDHGSDSERKVFFAQTLEFFQQKQFGGFHFEPQMFVQGRSCSSSGRAVNLRSG